MSGFEAGSIFYTIEARVGALLTGGRQVDRFNNDAQRGFNQTDRQVNSLNASMGRLSQVARAVTAALVTNQIFAYASAWNDLEDRLKNTGLTAYELKNVQDQLMETSNRNGRTIEESAELYIRLSNSMAEMGYSTQSTLSYIDSLSNLMTINKTSTQSAESAINALTKAQMKGKLSGDEAMSVFNAMPSVLKTLAAQFKTTEAGVKQMASNGKLSMSDFQAAIISAQPELAKLADNMRNNLGDATNHFTNELKKALGEMNNSTGAIQGLVDGIKYLADNMGALITTAEMIAAIFAGRYISAMAAAAALSSKKLKETLSLAVAEKNLAKTALATAQAEKASALAAHQSLIAQMSLAQTEKTRNALRVQIKASVAALTAATNAETVAQTRLAAAIKATSFATNTLKGAMAFLGGPAGVILIAATALMTWSVNADTAKQSALDLSDYIADLKNKFAALNEENKKLELSRLAVEIDKQNEAIKNQSASLYLAKTNFEDYSRRASGWASKLFTSQEGLNKVTLEYEQAQSDLAKMQDGLNDLLKTRDSLINLNTQSTENLTSSTKKLNNEFNETTKTNIEKNISKLSQELGIAELKQSKLNKEAYVYQNILATLGDEAGKYQASLLKSAQSGELFKGNIEGMPDQIYPLITALSELYDVNNSGADKTSAAALRIKELEGNIAVARLEVQGAIKDAKELKTLQDASASKGTEEEIKKIIELTEKYENLQAAKTGKSFAQEQVDNQKSPLEQIDIDEQAKLDRLNEWRATGLADEQLYQDSLTAITDEANKKRKKIDDDAAAAKLANTQALLSSSADLFGGMADLIGAFSNESGAAYKSMFAISKGFAIANATLSVASAAIKAMDDPLAVTPAQKFANYAAVAVAGGNLVSQLSSISYGGGRLTGGSVDASKMYRVNESGQPEMYVSNGKQYMLPNRNGEVIPANKLGGSSAPVVNWSINVINNTDSSIEQSVNPDSKQIDIIVNKAVNKVNESIRTHTGSTWQAMQSSTNIKAKLG